MTPWKYRELTGRPPPRRGLLGLGLGAGLCGAALLGARFFIRPATTARIPEVISPPVFATRLFASSRGQMVYHESVPPGENAAAAPALVFVHGLGVGTSSYEWSKVYPAFTGTHRVLAPDLIGFGESERPREALRAADQVAVLEEFLRALVEETEGAAPPPVLIARGLAAGLGVRLAAERPELVSRLILLLPKGRAEVPLTLQLASRSPTFGRLAYRNYVARRAAIRQYLETEAFTDPARISEEMVEVHALCAQQYQAGFTVRALWRGWLDVALEKHFRALTRPTTLLVPDRAPLRARERAEHLCRSNPARCRRRELPGLGPLAALEAPATITAALAEELAPALATAAAVL